MKKKFAYTCVNPESKEDLEVILENSKEITQNTFFKHICLDDFELSGFNKKDIKKEPYISFYKSKDSKEKEVVYFVFSAIEHIFK